MTVNAGSMYGCIIIIIVLPLLLYYGYYCIILIIVLSLLLHYPYY